MAPRHLLEVEGITKVYGECMAVDGVSLHLDPGEVVGLLGRNGAGKSTLFQMIIGLVKPTAGRVLFQGETVTEMSIHRRARRGMAYLPQERSVFRRLTVEENILAVLEEGPAGHGEDQTETTKILSDYGLLNVAKEKASSLSSTDARRLEICRSMLVKPSVLILDEPFSGVDPIAVSELQRHIRLLSGRGIGVLLTDHNVRESLQVCDRAYIIHNGRIISQGTPDQIVGRSAD